ncbi:hypothetical protein PAXRUDRAFT_169137 [Paxillus rubicundulus Ve08.2h10]|uniref:Uncharacterized protein n=1 Tax=Paxillus rubicundulus Ve08.2h10 TaxID=930991 RepID=A0A0D0CMY4_9AGAM|nr:hypothetical protein PAXRUDRAFT_169137 [Paxillus rubicundulus Ve08.2h10]
MGSNWLGDLERLIMAVATSDHPRILHLVSVALQQGASWRAIVRMLEGAVEKLSSSQGYSDKDFQIAHLVKVLGRPKLHYALHRALRIPSLSTTE